MFDIKQIYGLPIGLADRIIKLHGYNIEIIDYLSLRGKLGDDARVLRASIKENTVIVIVSWFCTDIINSNEECEQLI